MLGLSWESDSKFKEKSSQNKTNRASTRGGAVHSTGHKSHVEIALGLERKHGCPVNPDELFLVTHKKKDGAWVDTRARETYDTYAQRVWDMELDSLAGSTTTTTKIQR